MHAHELLTSIITHLGGPDVLARIGARAVHSDSGHINIQLEKISPNGARTVLIQSQPHDFFNVDVYGAIQPGTLTAPLIGAAKQVVPENLSTVFGKLTGIDTMHHRHF